MSEFTPTAFPAKISSQCGILDDDQQLLKSLQQVKEQRSSCKSIHNINPLSSSGYYSVAVANGSVVQVYCDMEGTNCGGERGWMRVAYVNMTQAGAACPVGLNQRSINNKSYCGSTGSGCNETIFPTLVEYSRVRGRVQGYQYGSPVAFFSYNTNTNNIMLNDNYVDGVSITYGIAPRKHLWTYAAGARDHVSYTGAFDCPCKQNSTIITPPFVGNDYYCESGVELCCKNVFSNDRLWDGEQCGGEAPCCIPNMPWFTKTLNETTTENIQLRLCKNDYFFSLYDTDIPLDFVEIFVQ